MSRLKTLRPNENGPKKKLTIFDLDGTLAETKSSLDAGIAKLFSALLGIVKVAVISGGDWPRCPAQLRLRIYKQGVLRKM